ATSRSSLLCSYLFERSEISERGSQSAYKTSSGKVLSFHGLPPLTVVVPRILRQTRSQPTQLSFVRSWDRRKCDAVEPKAEGRNIADWNGKIDGPDRACQSWHEFSQKQGRLAVRGQRN